MADGGKSAGELLALCEDVLKKAAQKGADQAEVYAEHGRQTAVSLEQNDIKGTSIDTHQAVGLRLFVGDRMGFAYANRLDPTGLDEALDDALAIAKSSPGDDANGLVDPQDVAEVAGLHEAALAGLLPDEVVDRSARMLQAAAAADARLRIDGSMSVTTFDYAVASSRGVRAAGQETSGSYGLFGMAVDGDQVGSFDHAFEGVRTLAEFDEARVAREFADKALSLLRPVEGKSYKGKVLFNHEAFEEIFLGALLSSIDGDTVFKGKSRLKDKLGQRVAVPGLSVVDDGTLPGRIGSGHFDREGLPHRRFPILEEGVLQGFLYDGKAARRAGATPTGHGAGSARSLPMISTTNLDVAPGSHSEQDLLAELGDGLLVTRFAGRVDSVSGDFSGVAKGSFLVEGGQKGPSVRETLIAGNVFELLERIVGIGSELHTSMSTRAPWVLIDGIDVTAGAGE